MELTKKQRHKCYKLAVQFMKHGQQAYLFAALKMAVYEYTRMDVKENDHVLMLLPEFNKITKLMKVNSETERHWYGWMTKKGVLEYCIQETAEEETT